MTHLTGAGNWRLKIKRYENGIEILHAVTCDEKAVLPDELLGLPVTMLGRRAFGTGAQDEQGEEVLIICGPTDPEAVWDNRGIRELRVPPTLERLGDFAFSGCGGLRTLYLSDNVESFGGNVFTTCRKLNRIFISRDSDEQGIALSHIADELLQELDVTIIQKGCTTRLIFPQYEEAYEEIYPARGVHFAYHIYGAGYLHHHCFEKRKLSLKAYDDIWEKYMLLDYDKKCALRLAWHRLRYPVELTEHAKKQYLEYVGAHSGEALEWLASEHDAAGLAFLMKNAKPDMETISKAISAARETGDAETLALLLEEQHKRQPVFKEKSFEL